MALVPPRFLVRVAHPCPYVKAMPDADGDRLLDLPEAARLQTFAAQEGRADIGDVRLAWNDFGLGVQVTVTGKEEPTAGDADKPRASDGLTLWLDTRDARAGHRASRTCHQFHFLPAGGGPEHSDPAFTQTKIARAQTDAPLAGPADVPLRCHKLKSGYRLEAYLPAAVLAGFDPSEHPRLGVYYHLRDRELGDQYLAVSADFPFETDPSLWEVLALAPAR
jgi:hypothetical protein